MRLAEWAKHCIEKTERDRLKNELYIGDLLWVQFDGEVESHEQDGYDYLFKFCDGSTLRAVAPDSLFEDWGLEVL